MLNGTIQHQENASNSRKLSINGTLPTQNFISLREGCIEKYDLKVGDKVLYNGMMYEKVFVYSKLNPETGEYERKD